MDARVGGASLQRALSASQPSVQLLPCSIDTDGYCKVEQYFSTTMSPAADKICASFRGRPLQGRDVTLPDGFMGIILREDKKPLTDQQNREFTVQYSFNSFRYWNLDKPTSHDDGLGKALDWLNIADAIHSPVDKNETNS
jgi:ribonuclease H2 subunit C